MKCSVFIATSLDGYIATPDGDVDWLDTCGKQGVDLGDDADMGFSELMASVDCLIMGRNTLEKLASFGLTAETWPYGDVKVIGLSRTLKTLPAGFAGLGDIKNNIELFAGSIPKLIEKLEQQGLSHAYIDGGAVVTSFLKLKLIDDVCITLAPVLLGKGIRLFGEMGDSIQLEKASSKVFANDFVQVRYNVEYL